MVTNVMIRVFALASCVLLIGCASRAPIWVKAGSTPTQAAQDARECEYEAERTIQQQPAIMLEAQLIAAAQASKRKENFRAMCMEIRGYREQ